MIGLWALQTLCLGAGSSESCLLDWFWGPLGTSRLGSAWLTKVWASFVSLASSPFGRYGPQPSSAFLGAARVGNASGIFVVRF